MQNNVLLAFCPRHFADMGGSSLSDGGMGGVYAKPFSVWNAPQMRFWLCHYD
jgi:hypothetical protein